jgi:hypothetical protein
MKVQYRLAMDEKFIKIKDFFKVLRALKIRKYQQPRISTFGLSLDKY